MLNRVMVILAAVLLAVFGVALSNDNSAEAVQPSFICEPLDGGKIDTVGDPATVEVTAPEGMLISGYCVKAGTEKFFIPVVPPQKTVIVDHPVKDSVSHYSLTYTPAPTPTTSPTPTPSPTETPEARTHSYIWVCTVCGDRYICAKQEFKLSMLEETTT